MKADKELIASIVEKCDFSKMKKEKDPLENKSEWRDGVPGMYRKGNVQNCPALIVYLWYCNTPSRWLCAGAYTVNVQSEFPEHTVTQIKQLVKDHFDQGLQCLTFQQISHQINVKKIAFGNKEHTTE